MATYENIGRRPYDEHEPGAVWVGEIEPDREKRAVDRGAIRVIDRRVLSLDPASVRPPKVSA